jgi:hypothetical protein
MNKVTFPETDSPLRTDVAFDEMAYNDHQHGTSTLSQLSVGMVSNFPLDPMHLVYLGVVKHIISSWIKGPIANKCRIGFNAVSQISASLLSCQKYVPREFPRKCRSLDVIDRWKATEFRQFLLYSGIVVIKRKVSEAVYRHFSLLFVAIFCLSSPLHIPTHCKYADALLRLFVKEWGRLYGRDMYVYNVHGLVHLASDARNFGALDGFSAFPFENHLGKLKKLVRKPNHAIPQVIRRLSEMKGKPAKKNEKGPVLNQEHASGPILFPFKTFLQYKSMEIDGLRFSTQDRNSCVQIGSKYGLIRNICRDPNNMQSEPVVMFEQFTAVTEFFQYPLDSSDLGIVKVSSLSGFLKAEKVSSFVSKFFRIPYKEHRIPLNLNKEEFVLVPLLHQLF